MIYGQMQGCAGSWIVGGLSTEAGCMAGWMDRWMDRADDGSLPCIQALF